MTVSKSKKSKKNKRSEELVRAHFPHRAGCTADPQNDQEGENCNLIKDEDVFDEYLGWGTFEPNVSYFLECKHCGAKTNYAPVLPTF